MAGQLSTPPVTTPAAEATRADLREALVGTLRACTTPHYQANGYHVTKIARSLREIADTLLAGPLATLIADKAAAEARERVALAQAATERARADGLAEDNRRSQDRIDALEEALQRIVQWADSYPTDIFAPPDYKAIGKTLTANGFVPGHTLDGIAADCMRQATEGVGKIARLALAGSDDHHPHGGDDADRT